MHNDLRFIESDVLGVAVKGNWETLPLEERVDRLANALHGLIRVVNDALEELDDLRAGHRSMSSPA
jgi:hypothetical protein